jgi:hypothetical protein
MQLLKFFFNLEIVGPPYPAGSSGDPLNHPDLARMSPTELADLPLYPQDPPPLPEQLAPGECP